MQEALDKPELRLPWSNAVDNRTVDSVMVLSQVVIEMFTWGGQVRGGRGTGTRGKCDGISRRLEIPHFTLHCRLTKQTQVPAPT